MIVREKVGAFYNQSGEIQGIVGILIHVLGMNPVAVLLFYFVPLLM